MKTSVAVLLEPEYFSYKKDYINDNFIVTHYISYIKECIGKTIDGQTIIALGDIMHVSFEKIIIALPLSQTYKIVINLLREIGIADENIILLFGKPHYYVNESVHNIRNDIDYRIHNTGDIVACVDDCRFLITTNEELYILKEIFAQKCYDFFIPESKITILDIGMNVGIASVFFAKTKNADKIYSFEPFPQTYSYAIENITLNDVTDKITPHQYGLGDSNQNLDLEYNENLKGSMSTVRSNLPYSIDNNKRISIKIMDAADIFQSIIDKHHGCAFVIKIDCEGSEYNILKRLNEAGLLSYVRLFIMEWHNFGGNNVAQIESILQQNNFAYHVIGARSHATGMLFALNSNFKTTDLP